MPGTTLKACGVWAIGSGGGRRSLLWCKPRDEIKWLKRGRGFCVNVRKTDAKVSLIKDFL